MPTISINRNDLEQLLSQSRTARGPLTIDALESWLSLVKGELKNHDEKTGELRVELQDSNRPDLWSSEGIARQIRTKLMGGPPSYPFFQSRTPSSRRLLVSPGLEYIRPYVAACSAVGYEMTDAGLVQLIQTQEKLAEIFGRQRRTVSIGLYRLGSIVFPVTYRPATRNEARFTPLGFDEKMSLDEILVRHPKGVEYGSILAGHEHVPLLVDAEGQALSMPPIINSREIGEIRVGDHELLVEVTGTDLTMVLLTLNILAANLADRGASIGTIETAYPYETDRGKTVPTPLDFGHPRDIAITTFESVLGQPLHPDQIRRALLAYGYEVALSQEMVSVKLPPYRHDAMHAVDVVEDMAISQGYHEFAPIMPSEFTVGGLSRLEQGCDRMRDLMVGIGFQEIMSNILTSRVDVVDRMRLAGSEWDRVIEVDNVMSQSFACLRRDVLPSLLRVESASARAFYPHRLFEVGEVAIPDSSDDQGACTLTAAGALIAHADANFSEIHSYLDGLLYYFGRSYRLEPLAHPWFMEGRAGLILCNDRSVGMIGELHPEVLEEWQITMPCAAFELLVDRLTEPGPETDVGA